MARLEALTIRFDLKEIQYHSNPEIWKSKSDSWNETTDAVYSLSPFNAELLRIFHIWGPSFFQWDLLTFVCSRHKILKIGLLTNELFSCLVIANIRVYIYNHSLLLYTKWLLCQFFLPHFHKAKAKNKVDRISMCKGCFNYHLCLTVACVEKARVFAAFSAPF